MSEEKTADAVGTAPAPAPAEANAIPNGKGHEAGEEITALPAGEAEK